MCSVTESDLSDYTALFDNNTFEKSSRERRKMTKITSFKRKMQ